MTSAARWASAWIGVALCCLLALLPAGARAQSLPGRTLAVCVTPVRAGDTLASIVAAPAARFGCTASQTGRPPGSYWVRAAPLPDGAVAGPVDIRFASLWQERAAVAAVYADHTVAVTRLDSRQLSQHLRLGAMVTVRVPQRAAPVTAIVWRIDGAAVLRGIVAMPMIATPDQTNRSDLLMAALYAGFTGLCVALLIYNIALYAAMRLRFQLVYCLMVVSLLGYACSISGVLAWIVPGIDNNDRLRCNYLFLASSGSFALLFARTFFEREVFAGRLARIADVVIVLPVAAGVIFAVGAPHAIGMLDRLYSLCFLPLLLMVVPMLWRAWRMRSNYLWLFAIAWGTPVAMGLLRVAAGIHLVRWNLWIDQSTILSMALEALLSSLAIAYRIRLLAAERDHAREQEVAARLLADSDPLTALINRRAFMRQAIGRSGDQTLLVVDIDHFKRVNETIGHDGGDEVLRVVARALRSAVPADALVARIGGEEFAIVGDAGRPVAADAVLDALRRERMPFDITVTASIGLCTGPLQREVDWKALYRCADQALFAAKAAGRDRARDAGVIARAA